MFNGAPAAHVTQVTLSLQDGYRAVFRAWGSICSGFHVWLLHGILVGNTNDDNDDDEKMTMTTER